ncbi:sugar ABC transporter permease [Acuticoccus sp. M5D2P5]|uniref:carbohydrate ABC transporter permease n=1 Tax=Acuticoccus kalidii TaxID=2910977 RepID=UPI001F17137E|nr:sugar ABC transporter permease [Acuticoccus kalidii]MCF3934043.1 sugar ABC transporter permease [Acuticoccus kalidii]
MSKRRGAALEGSPWTPYVFIFPLVAYLFAILAGPLLQEFWISFTDTSLMRPDAGQFIGLSNYRFIISDPNFHQVLIVTALYTAGSVVFGIGLGLGTALLMNHDFRGRSVARALVTIPWAAPSVAVALIFSWMFNAQYGIFTILQKSLGLASGAENWLDSTTFALPAVLIATVWQIFPFSSVVILAALQGVPSEVKEAAIIDRADRLNVFKTVTWPTIAPTVALISLFTTIWSLRRFDIIWILTGGGPLGATNTLVTELYREGFIYRDLGTAAAIGMIGLLIASVVTLLYYGASRRAEMRARGAA